MCCHEPAAISTPFRWPGPIWCRVRWRCISAVNPASRRIPFGSYEEIYERLYQVIKLDEVKPLLDQIGGKGVYMQVDAVHDERSRDQLRTLIQPYWRE